MWARSWGWSPISLIYRKWRSRSGFFADIGSGAFRDTVMTAWRCPNGAGSLKNISLNVFVKKLTREKMFSMFFGRKSSRERDVWHWRQIGCIPDAHPGIFDRYRFWCFLGHPNDRWSCADGAGSLKNNIFECFCQKILRGRVFFGNIPVGKVPESAMSDTGDKSANYLHPGGTFRGTLVAFWLGTMLATQF